MKPAMNPKTVKQALKIAAVVIAIATAVVAEWEAGAITDAASFVTSLAEAIGGAVTSNPDDQPPASP